MADRLLLSISHKMPTQCFPHAPMESENNKLRKYFVKFMMQLNLGKFYHQLTETIMETMLFKMPSISAGSPSLKQTSHTPMILCKSSSMPLFDFSSEISAPKLLKYRRNSWAWTRQKISIKLLILIPKVIGYKLRLYTTFELGIESFCRTYLIF